MSFYRWILLGCVVATSPCFGEVVTTTPFQGIRHFQITKTDPRELSIHLLEVDLNAPGIQFQLTEPNGVDDAGETDLETTRQFVDRVGAQVGVNVHFYSIVLETDPVLSIGTDVISLAASNGTVYSPFQNNYASLNLAEDNTATYFSQAAGDTTGFATDPPLTLYNALSGSHTLIRDGVIVANPGGNLEPRTVIGTTADERLLLLTVDGRNPGHSLGMSFFETAELMADYGATNAINLDGGGSTTLVFADPTARVVNIPVGLGNNPGSERPVGSNLAIFARPVPEVSPALLIGTLMVVATLSTACRASRASGR